MSITVGWWALPLIITVLAWRWAFKPEHVRGDYNFTVVFTVPTAAAISMTAWAAYFGVMWWLA